MALLRRRQTKDPGFLVRWLGREAPASGKVFLGVLAFAFFATFMPRSCAQVVGPSFAAVREVELALLEAGRAASQDPAVQDALAKMAPDYLAVQLELRVQVGTNSTRAVGVAEAFQAACQAILDEHGSSLGVDPGEVRYTLEVMEPRADKVLMEATKLGRERRLSW